MELSTALAFLVGVLLLSQASSVHVRLDNGVEAALAVHCKAEEGTEVGTHTIPPRAYWLFSINPNPQRTRYQCNFSWSGESHDLRIYDDARGLTFDTYHWAVNVHGACLLMDSIGTLQCYSWRQVAMGN